VTPAQAYTAGRQVGSTRDYDAQGRVAKAFLDALPSQPNCSHMSKEARGQTMTAWAIQDDELRQAYSRGYREARSEQQVLRSA
jgi:ribosomal protein S12 methylthiotransferase accessory factor YcaO